MRYVASKPETQIRIPEHSLSRAHNAVATTHESVTATDNESTYSVFCCRFEPLQQVSRDNPTQSLCVAVTQMQTRRRHVYPGDDDHCDAVKEGFSTFFPAGSSRRFTNRGFFWVLYYASHHAIEIAARKVSIYY